MTLHTADLELKTVEASDLDEVARMWAFEKGPISHDEARKAIDYMQANHQKNAPGHIHHLCFAVFVKGESRIIGWCGLDGKTAGKLYIFYMIDAAYRNRGYATQCAARLLSYAFDEAHVPFVNGGCFKDNTASYRVQEKIGMAQNAFEENGDPLFYIDAEMYREKISK
jgi:RimJ/RimL family protein N-acetyltransferase